jgi:rhomboid protease GluP
MQLWTPGPGFKISPAFAALNILVFLVLAAWNLSFTEYSPASLYWLGANFAPWVEQGQWWRFLTSMFLHFGLMHLLFNTVSLLFLGRILEPMLGYLPFATIYLLTGICGSAASYLFNDTVISAGASGGIFGLFGVFIAVLLTNIMRKDVRDEWLKSVGAILAINLGMGLFLPVDNAAHLGGLLTGFVLGVIMIPFIKKRLRQLMLSRSF